LSRFIVTRASGPCERPLKQENHALPKLERFMHGPDARVTMNPLQILDFQPIRPVSKCTSTWERAQGLPIQGLPILSRHPMR
jgi:hypothetical protein